MVDGVWGQNLDSTIEQGLKANLDIQMAAARFEQTDLWPERSVPCIGRDSTWEWTPVEIKS